MADDMRQVILDQPNQIRHSLDVNKHLKLSATCDSLILAGMGGSGHPGDLLNALHLPQVPLTVYRSYNLPPIMTRQPLIIVSSYSGNTEEALSAYQAAREHGYSILINTAGGKLTELSQQDTVPLVKIDFPGMQPRHTLLASFTGLYITLANSQLVSDITSDLLRVAQVLETIIPQQEAEAKALAEKLKNKTPIFTASDGLGFVAKNSKIQTNENAKTPAFWNEFPELNHNEMIGFAQPQAKFHVVMLRDEDDHPRIKARMEVTAELYQQWGVEVSTVAIKGQTLLEKICYGVTFGLWTTFHLALLYGIDPVPVAGVEDFKKRLEVVAGPL